MKTRTGSEEAKYERAEMKALSLGKQRPSSRSQLSLRQHIQFLCKE